MLWVLVAIRVLVNPLSNVWQKLLAQRDISATSIIGYTHGLLTLACAPLLLVEAPPATREFWTSMLVCALLGVAGNVLIVKALEVGDLSLLGPINSFKPVVSLVPGVVLLREFPAPLVLAGVGLVIVGSYIIAGSTTGRLTRSNFGRLLSDRGVQYRLAALVLSATEAVFIKRALLVSSALPTFAVWSVMGFVLLLPCLVTRSSSSRVRRSTLAESCSTQSIVKTFVLLAVTTGLMQFCTIVILGGYQVAAALALFQTSTLVSVLLGWRVFREPAVLHRLLGSAVMMAGAIIIVTAH